MAEVVAPNMLLMIIDDSMKELEVLEADVAEVSAPDLVPPDLNSWMEMGE